MATATTAKPGHAAPQPGAATTALLRWGSRVLLPALGAVALLVVLAYAVFPVRTWLDQRQAISDRQAELAELEAVNIELDTRVQVLNTEAEIERIARTDHGLVRPGEEAYAVLPPAPVPVRLPSAWPFTELAFTLAR
ncbi:MAG: FtsB family cell division protein [Acidimicrobiales bacterium]